LVTVRITFLACRLEECRSAWKCTKSNLEVPIPLSSLGNTPERSRFDILKSIRLKFLTFPFHLRFQTNILRFRMAQLLTITSSGQAPAVNFHLQEVPSPKANEVLVKLLAAPINPLDILVLADLYPVRPNHKHAGEPIPGYDGVGEVVSCGVDVKSLAPGNLVVPRKFGIGTWRSHVVLDAQSLQKVSRPVDLSFAAILRITIAPAFCLVEDMCNLKPGDYIIQNAGTSALAQMVVQFARRRGVGVINVVRDRPTADLEAVKKSLHELGADVVVSETEFAKDASITTRRITLALDSVFGSSSRGLVKALGVGGTYVQLGFLGGPKGPLTLDPLDLFGRQLTMKAFRGSAQVGMRSAEEQQDLFNWFVALFNGGELRLPPLGLQKIAWDLSDNSGSKERLVQAVERAQKGALGQRKQIIVFK
jgi:trans-2-enoyl-CoA reductase